MSEEILAMTPTEQDDIQAQLVKMLKKAEAKSQLTLPADINTNIKQITRE